MANPWEEYAQAAPAGPWDEYDQRKRPAVPPMVIDTADGMSALDKALVGAGSSLTKAYQGLTDPFVSDETRQERKDERDLYARHRGDLGGYGTAGEVVGDAAAYAPLALVPGGVAVQMATGAAGSAAMTPGSLEERAKAGAMGGVGAGVGNVLTRTLGRVAKPIGDKAADTVSLEALGVRPTFGQGMGQKTGALPRSIARMEEGAMSVPIASGPLRSTRRGVQEQWQQATRDAALPPGRTGARSVDEVRRAYTDAYTSALDSVPLPYASVQYAPDMRALSSGSAVSMEQRDTVERVFNEIRLKNMQNPTPGAQVTASGAHGTESELKSLAARYKASQDPAQQDLGMLFDQVAHDYGQTWRGALPQNVRQNVAAIDSSYPEFAAIRDAARKVGATASDSVPDNYTPAVLSRSARNVDRSINKTRYIAGDAPQQELARLGQSVQGKVPDSGTTERVLGGSALLGAGALGQLPAVLAGGGALAAYGTRPVQNYLMGRSAPQAQQYMMELLRDRLAPYAAAAGASQSN